MMSGYETELRKTLEVFPYATVVQPKVAVIDSKGNVCSPLVDRVKRVIQGNILQDFEIDSKKLVEKLFIGDFLYFPAIAWKTKVLTAAKWNLTYRDAVDLDLLFKLSISGEPFVFQSVESFRYRRHSESVSSILAQEDTRLREELATHFMARNLLSENSYLAARILAILAPTVRIHALIIGMKQIPKHPLNGLRHIAKALAPLKPIS